MTTIKLLSCEQAAEHRQSLEELLEYCSSSDVIYPEGYFKKKIEELLAYLQEDRAFLFGASKDEELVGFLWACELKNSVLSRFHVLYFAVSEKEHNQGIGQSLLSAAECKAKELGYADIELNVHVSNSSAQKFYLNRNFFPQRITMVKELS